MNINHMIDTRRGPMGAVHICKVCGHHVVAPKSARYASTKAHGELRTHVAEKHPKWNEEPLRP